MRGLLSVVAALALAMSGAVAQDDAPPTGGTATVRGADLRLLQAVRSVASRVASLRDARFARPPVAVRAPEVMQQVAAEIRVHSVLSAERLAARGRAWASVGLGEGGAPAAVLEVLARDLEGAGLDPPRRRLLVSAERLAQTDVVAGAELDEAATLFLVTGVLPDEPAFAHLIVHLMQLEGADDPLSEPTTDGLLARAAIAEGEANLVALRYLFAGMGLANAVIDESLGPQEYLGGRLVPAGLEQSPPGVRELLRFVYADGFAEVSRRFRLGGWPAVDAARRDCRTTSDVLHGVETRRPLPDADPPVDGLRRVDADSLGEQAIAVLLALTTGKDNLALQAADGWDGDRLTRWEHPQGPGAGPGVTRWDTRWRREEDAREFAYAFRRSVEARYPASRTPAPAAPVLVRLATPDAVVTIAWHERRVEILVAPAAPDAGDPEGSPRGTDSG